MLKFPPIFQDMLVGDLNSHCKLPQCKAKNQCRVEGQVRANRTKKVSREMRLMGLSKTSRLNGPNGLLICHTKI